MPNRGPTPVANQPATPSKGAPGRQPTPTGTRSGSPGPPGKQPAGQNPGQSSGQGSGHIGGLKITDEADHLQNPNYPESEYQQTDVPAHSSLFLAVSAAVNLGIALLECDRGKTSLVNIGIEVVRAAIRFQTPHVFPDTEANRTTMTPHVDEFLRQLRGQFVPILLTNHIGGEARVTRFNWAQAQAGQPAKTMKDYVAAQAGFIKINKFVFETLVVACRERQTNGAYDKVYELQMFLMAIAIAHEVAHLFVSFRHGSYRPNTPASITFLPMWYNKPSPDGLSIDGESGRRWEADVFGGAIEHFAEPIPEELDKHPLKQRQAGDLWLFDAHENAQLVERAAIRRVFAFDFSPQALPLRTAGPLLTMSTSIGLDTP
ncbi:hypothetical protein N658DRAFT_502191 [Parathielavia hyrcaniae]|uniref:Uncharacterized protein n=1 Tax=Parathielavia hyrcaniae TaxID=113614 RepID=A0AAN6PQL4_9PEZI|nr:hypothetical protein N658DRAFT_502191 [Parathielavia hyrcaniae]